MSNENCIKDINYGITTTSYIDLTSKHVILDNVAHKSTVIV